MLKKMTLEKQNPSLPRGNSSHCCWAWPFQLRFNSTSPKKLKHLDLEINYSF